MTYIALIADIVASRKAADRDKVQDKLVTVLDQINELGRDRLASPFTVTLGDEFQALYIHPAGLFSDLWRISAALHPVKVRYAIGVGSLSTPVNPEQALGMDGPAFYSARDGLEAAKEQHALFRLQGSIPQLELINHSLDLISHLATDWQANRYAIQAELSAGTSPKTIAKQIGISDSAVYKNISAAALHTITSITQQVETTLEDAL